jgi:hypothetical protein
MILSGLSSRTSMSQLPGPVNRDSSMTMRRSTMFSGERSIETGCRLPTILRPDAMLVGSSSSRDRHFGSTPSALRRMCTSFSRSSQRTWNPSVAFSASCSIGRSRASWPGGTTADTQYCS